MWHKRGGFSIILFVPGTSGEVLTDKVRKVKAENHQNKTWCAKVVGVITLKYILQRSDPSPPTNCDPRNVQSAGLGHWGSVLFQGGSIHNNVVKWE
jgi:hypothetical protein